MNDTEQAAWRAWAKMAQSQYRWKRFVRSLRDDLRAKTGTRRSFKDLLRFAEPIDVVLAAAPMIVEANEDE